MFSTSPRVTITRRIHPAAEQLLRDAGCEVFVHPHNRPMTRQELVEAAMGSDAVLCLLTDRIDALLLEVAPRCRMYANYAVGFDNMDVEAARRAGVQLSNTPDVLTQATAEFAWALLFAVARRVVEGDRFVREGRFTGWDPSLLWGYDLSCKTLGIIGAGRIGGAMARRARGFEMSLLYTTRHPPSPGMEELGARHASLEEVLAGSDFLSVHTPLTPETHHLISDSQFALMKPNAILVNTARGPVVDEKALVRALQSGRIAGAGLDVYEREPEVEPELLSLPNVVLAPHIASATHETRRKMAELAASNILDALSGRRPRTALT